MLKQLQHSIDRWTVRREVGSCDERGLVVAIRNSDFAMVQLMLDLGVSPDATSDQGEPALHLAIEKGNMKLLRLLLERGANLYANDHLYRTVLMRAVENGFFLVFEYLLEKGAEIHAHDLSGDTALIKASRLNQLSFVKRLLEAGAAPDLRNHAGHSALMLAVEHLNTSMIRALLLGGADPNQQDDSGRTPLDLPGITPRIENMLREAGGKPAWGPPQPNRIHKNGTSSFSETETRNLWYVLTDLVFSTLDWLSNPSQTNAPSLELMRKYGKDLLPFLDLHLWAHWLEELDKNLAIRVQLEWAMAAAIEAREIGELILSRLSEDESTPINTRIRNEVLVTLREMKQQLESRKTKSSRHLLSVPAIYGQGPFLLIQWLETAGSTVFQGKTVAEVRVPGGVVIRLRAPETGKLHQQVAVNQSFPIDLSLGWVDEEEFSEPTEPISEPMSADSGPVKKEQEEAIATEYAPIPPTRQEEPPYSASRK